MGLDASVSCNCFREGKVRPFPLAHLVRLDSEGHWEFEAPHAGHEDDHARFDEWLENACEHGRMEAVTERVSNWSGLRSFQQALRDAGADRFPALLSELPERNGGATSPELAKEMIRELNEFRARPLGMSTWLVDSETGDRLYEHVELYDGVFLKDGRTHCDMGVDGDGFFIVDTRMGLEVFRSDRFEQVLVEKDLTERHLDGRVELTDLDTGRSWRGHCAVPGAEIPWPDGRLQNEHGQVRFRYPPRLHTEARERRASSFGYIVEPLLRLCRASIETGNSIRWM